jgi:LmbE family N-acetylglucosaminyl deacetylase
MISLCPRDRLLIFAPHPDDESLAAGGLLQKAVAIGARVRVLFVTSGDNNPWPQRFLERRWRIGPQDRARWGARREAEGLAALKRLGIGLEAGRFLRFPDQGLRELLMNGDESIEKALLNEWQAFAPTIAVAPSLEDVHPDHSSLRVLIEFLILAIGQESLPLYEYLVHAPGVSSPKPAIALPLTAGQVTAKLEAIQCHRTQTTLQPRRLAAFAAEREYYRTPDRASAWSGSHPIAHGAIERGFLGLTIVRQRAKRRPKRLLIAAQDSRGRSLRWSVPIPPHSGSASIRRCQDGDAGGVASIRHRADRIEVTTPIPDIGPRGIVFAKLLEPTLFFDSAGWRHIPTPVSPYSGGSSFEHAEQSAAGSKRAVVTLF